MKKNLLYIVTKLELGGAQKHVLDLIRLAGRDDFNIFLFTAKDGLLNDEARSIAGLNIYFSRHLERPMRPVKDLLALREIVSFIRRNNIDVVHTHSSKAGILGRWAAKLAKTPVVIHTVHGWSFNDYQSFLARTFFVRLERWAAKFTDKIIVVSSWDKKKGLDYRIGREGQYVEIPCGIDFDAFAKEKNNNSLKAELGLSEHDLVVGSVACLKRQKAPQDFLRLAGLVKEAVPEVKFLFAGDGELSEDANLLRQRLGLEKDVFFLGWQKDIPRFLGALDVFVLTSWWEGLPMSVLEAMASSKAIVATDTGGVRDVVLEGQTGFLVPVRDVKGMKEKVVSFLTDASRRRQCADAARRSLKDAYRRETMARQVFGAYKDLLEKKAQRYAF